MTIEKHSSILKDPRIKRIVEHNEGEGQINLLDQRFYRRNAKYYPSVTSILNYYPKGKYFDDWLKTNGHNSENIAAKAANEGKQVHSACEDFINGEEIKWLDCSGNALYSLDVWRMILRFADFWNTHKPQVIATEYHLFSDQYEFAGTADIICRFQDSLWVLDIKTSNSISTTHELQLAAYTKAWNETHNEHVTHNGIIWLKSPTRKEGKGKIQGNGWQLKTYNEIEKSFEVFSKIYDIYRLENPNARPYSEILPTSVKMLD